MEIQKVVPRDDEVQQEIHEVEALLLEQKEELIPKEDEEWKFSNLIVNYLPLSFRERHMRKIFAQFGEIKNCRVMRFAQAGRTLSKGYGFVEYETTAQARRAIRNLNGKNILGKNLKVGFARPSGSRLKSNLFVSQIPERWTEEDLDKVFGVHGEIIERRCLRDADGASRRSAFVRFDTNEQAKKAIHALNCTRPTILDQNIVVRVASEHESSVANRKEKTAAKPKNGNKKTRRQGKFQNNSTKGNRRRNNRKEKNNNKADPTKKANNKSSARSPLRNRAKQQGTMGPKRESFRGFPSKNIQPRNPSRRSQTCLLPSSQRGERQCAPPLPVPSSPPLQFLPQMAQEPSLERIPLWKEGTPPLGGTTENFMEFRENGEDFVRHLIDDSEPRNHMRFDYEPSRRFVRRDNWDRNMFKENWNRAPRFPREFDERRYEEMRDFPPNPYMNGRGRLPQEPSAPPREPHQAAGPRKKTGGFVVHLANIPSFLDQDVIYNMCAVYGEILDLQTTIDNNGRAIGGLVTLFMDDDKAADRVVEAFHGCVLGGQVVRCSRARDHRV